MMRPSAARSVPIRLVLLGLSACATTRSGGRPAVEPSAPVTRYEFEPLKIQVVKEGGGTHIEAFDAADLFEQAGAALSAGRLDDAIGIYDRLLAEFAESRYTRAALYNVGLAHQGKKDWARAVVRFKALADGHPESAESKDALFQLGACYAEQANWPTSAEVFARVLERKDLTADDKIEALARRGFAQFNLKDLDTAERTFKSALLYWKQIETEERLATDFYVGLCQYHLGKIPHERFRAIALRLPETQMSRDMDDKARLLLAAQRQYIDTIRLGNPQWASASGYQIGSLYQEFYDAFVRAPLPPELGSASKKEAREVYVDELRKKIRVLLEKAVRVHEQNLLMLERVGLDNEWREKSKMAYAHLQKLLDPKATLDASDAGGSDTDRPPPLPTSPAATPRTAPTPREPAPAESSPSPAPNERRERPREEIQRQIL